MNYWKITLLSLMCLLLTGCSAGSIEKDETMPGTTQETPVTTQHVFEEELPVVYEPSNWSDYDRNYFLGSDSMGWEFPGGWTFSLAGMSADASGITLEHTPRTEAACKLELKEYWLETWDGNQWLLVSEQTVLEDAIIFGGDAYGTAAHRIDWSEHYGKLLPGKYRAAIRYALTEEENGTEEQVCYAKFRIFMDAQKILIDQCTSSLEALAFRDSFHLIRSDYLLERIAREDAQYYTETILKYRTDYFRETVYYSCEDRETVGSQGMLLRSGEGFCWNSRTGMEWENADWITAENFHSWSFGLELSYASIASIEQVGNCIQIRNEGTDVYNFHEEIEYKMLSYEFDELGNLAAIRLQHHFADGSTGTQIELSICQTSEDDIRNMIDGQ